MNKLEEKNIYKKIFIFCLRGFSLIFFILTFNIFNKGDCFGNNDIYNYVDISQLAQLDITNLYGGFPLGIVEFGGIKFYIPPEKPNYFSTSAAPPPYNSFPDSGTFTVNIINPKEVYLLINGGATSIIFNDKTIGKIILNFSDSTELEEDIIAGYNFRDWNIEDPQNVVTTLDGTSNTKEVFRKIGGPQGEDIIVVDMMRVKIPPEDSNKMLSSITIKDLSKDNFNDLNPDIMIYGITIISTTPTPTPTPFYPVILIPGHGASFSREAFIYNKPVPQSDWKMTPFVHSYDGIIETFKNNLSYPSNKFYTFFYDWRKKIDSIAADFNDFLNNKVIPENNDLGANFKAKIVGHSLGGLVGRGYAQKYGVEKIDKLISAGSPHKGVIQAYKAWEGGELGERNAWQWLALQLLLQLNKRGFATNVETIRKIAPGTQDLLPIFDYLKTDLAIKPVNLMYQQNDWLKTIGVPNSSFFDVFTAIYGEKGNTPEFYRVEERSLIDKVLGKWEDGKPIETDYGSGDYTVLSKSAKFSEDDAELLNLDHGELVEKPEGIQKILEKLEIPYSSVSEVPATIYDPSLLFILASPATLEVKKPDGTTILADEDKLIFIENAQNGVYEGKVVGNDNGDYRLIVGQLTENGDFWSEYDGIISAGQEDVYKINFNRDSPLINPLSDEKGGNYLEQAKEKLVLIKEKCDGILINRAIFDIQKAINEVGNNRYHHALVFLEKGLMKIFGVRKKLSDIICRNLSYEAVENLSLAYPVIFKKTGQAISKKAIQNLLKATEKLLSERREKLNKAIKKEKITQNQVISFTLAEENFKKAKNAFNQNNYSYSQILLKIINLLLLEVV